MMKLGYHRGVSIKAGESLTKLIAAGVIGLFTMISTARADLNTGLVAYYPFNGNANDTSGNGNNGTVYGATLTTNRFGQANTAYSFNGVSSYIQVPDSNSLDLGATFTLSAWVLQRDSADGGIISKQRPSSGGGYALSVSYSCHGFLGMNNDDDGITYGHNLGVSSTNTILQGSWHYLVGVCDGSNVDVYVDGVKTGYGYWPWGALLNSNYPLYIGRNLTDAYDFYFGGIIDDIRIYNRALSATEISQLYTNSTTPVVSFSPIVSNVRASQRAQSQLVDIFYDLSATNSGPFSVAVSVSTNNGSTYDLPASSFTGGGVGSSVTLGTRKQIVWNAGVDWPGQYSSAVRFKVSAIESFAVSISPRGGTFNVNTSYAWNALVSGGNPPYSYLWTNTTVSGSFSSTNAVFQKIFTTIGSKKFVVNVTDSHGAVAVSSTNSIVVVQSGGGGGEL